MRKASTLDSKRFQMPALKDSYQSLLAAGFEIVNLNVLFLEPLRLYEVRDSGYRQPRR